MPGVAASSGLPAPAGAPLVLAPANRDPAASCASTGPVGVTMDVDAGQGPAAAVEGATAPMEVET
eukprot:8449728-Prorocentrum_lima.AAC.1